ncbi:hypothetical protein [Haloferula sp. A504]|uniref:hypothetical protein n=1 Tax=Haloferula sp. A504 TaxID=3373601 RepID=UPI0031CB2870|nr:hypothetical protein [Verrucomicrobiaceae bacterium E54]
MTHCPFRRSFALAFSLLATIHAGAQSSPHRGLWVGEATLSEVSQVTIPLDEDNIPRAPDPAVTAPTSDLAKLRLILHVDASGNVSLIKHVAIVGRKAGDQVSDSDLALVTDPRLYGDFPPQPATRISSVAFDFGDAKATGAVNEIAGRAAAAAATAAQAAGASIATVTAAAQAAAQTVIAEADAASAFSDFLQDPLTLAAVRSIATGGPTDDLEAKAVELFENSFFGDRRGIEMIQAILDAVAALPADATDDEKRTVAENTAASFVETDGAYDRFLASELLGDMIREGAEAGALAADALPPVPVDSFQPADPAPGTVIVSPAHGLVTNDEVAIFDTAIGAYGGVRKVINFDDDTFQIDVPFVTGGAISGYAALTNITPTTVESPAHGLSDGELITLRDSPLAAFNGKHLVSVIDADRFTIEVPFDSSPPVPGVWSVRSGEITGYAGTADGSAGIAVTAPDHGLDNGARIEIQGSGEPSYNGIKTITRIDDNSFSINQAFGGNPAQKGSWDLPRPIASFQPPSVVPTLVSSVAHGLSSGDRVVISGSDKAEYNGEQVVTVIDADSFSIGVAFDDADGDPAVKGDWVPADGGRWRKANAVRTAIEQQAKVVQARSEALTLQISTYSDSRARDAVEILIEAILGEVATDGSSLAAQAAILGEEAGREALATKVPRYPAPPTVPSLDYNDFIDTETFTSSVGTAASAAAEAAVKESENVISTPESIERRALDAATDAIVGTFTAASRAFLTELPMSGSFGPGASGLTGEMLLPANHPTNPFRHRRHPDHARGFDVNRTVTLSFFSQDDQPRSRAGYGIDRISGIYEEEIFGLHKPLGPDKDIGLRVRGGFQLQRISLIDTLNGR